ncbi:MAG TPA: argininosuccinate synthase domain-containing protein [Vicinamibacterales bacterium]|nr:argininosuccinate synthase domain-containing protein [Vicinamibacterales bacterium]
MTQTPAQRRIVIACAGSSDSVAAIPRLAGEFDAEVITVTLDIGQARELEGVRQAALAAGAVRAHVIDAREEFARDCMAALRNGQRPSVMPLVARKLDEVAAIEGATPVIDCGGYDDVETTLWQRSPGKPELNEPARLEIAFERGLPVSVNGVPMTLPEVIESVATIADAPPAAIFQAVHDALGSTASHAPDAIVCLESFKGQHRVLSAHHS